MKVLFKFGLSMAVGRWEVVAYPRKAVGNSSAKHLTTRRLSVDGKRICHNVQLDLCPGRCWDENGDEKCDNTVGNCDITGWHCLENQESLFCDCYEDQKSLLGGSTVICERTITEKCNHGSPPCLYGRCKRINEACGATWSLDPTLETCESLFSELDPSTKKKCDAVFGSMSAPICPESALGFGFRGWANVMKDVVRISDRLRAAALETIWFYDTLRGMMEGDIPARLNTTDITMHFETFRKFSCLRNLPQCAEDKPVTNPCEVACNSVTTAIYNWLGRCYDVARSPQNVSCSGLGYVRDCDGTLASAADGDLPGLCQTFQNEPMLRPSMAINHAVGQHFPFGFCSSFVLILCFQILSL